MEEKKENKTYLIDISEIQAKYLPLSKKKIRKIVTTYLRTIRVGSKLLVDREQLEKFLQDPDRDRIK